MRKTMQKVAVSLVVAGIVLVAAACGTTKDDRSTTGASTSLSATSAAVASSSVRGPSSSAGPVCEGDLLPALAAVDATSGEFQWTYCSAEQAWREIRGATDDIVYVDSTMPDKSAGAAGQGQLHAVLTVDARDGSELWRVPVAGQELGWPPGPFAGGGVVVVEIDDDQGAAIVGLDGASGATLWRVAVTDLGGRAASGTGPSSVVAPLANTDDVAVLSVPSGLVGLDRSTGKQIWSSDVMLLDESGVGVSRGPAAVDGSTVMVPAATKIVPAQDPSGQTVMAPMGPSALVAVDAATGETLWQGPRLDHPTAAEGFAVGYVNSGPDSTVIAVDAKTGAKLWSKPGRVSYGDLWAIGDGAVYVNDSGEGPQPDVVGYELESGAERWRRTTDASLPVDPQQVADAQVVLLFNNLAVLSTADGSTRWTTDATVAPDAPMSSVGHNTAAIFVSFNGLPWSD